MDSQRVTIIIIATNHYVAYLLQFIDSIPWYSKSICKARFLIFTDKPQLVSEKLSEREDLVFEVVEIPNYGWPEATLFRYEMISSGSYLEDETIAYLDADSKVLYPEFISNLFLEKEKVSMVMHPGYSWPPLDAFFRKPIRSFTRVVFLLITRVRENGFGTWETATGSRAYVEPENRRVYFCGGFWWGPKGPILAMCNQLAVRTRQDFANGTVARWHDESHLNWYAAMNAESVSVIPSSVLFSPSVSVTSRELGWIEAVDK